MTTVHQKLAVVLVLVSLAGALWAGYAASRHRFGERLSWLAWLATGLVLLEASLGIALAARGQRPPDATHFVFGPAALLVLPLGLGLSRGRSARAASRIAAASWVIALALNLRAVGTGGGLS